MTKQEKIIMEIIKLTKKEKEWIKELKKLIRKKPKSLILFADGHLNILKGSKENPLEVCVLCSLYTFIFIAFFVDCPSTIID